MARICPKCGAETNGLPVLCRACGARLGNAEYIPDKPKRRKKKGVGGFWLILLVLGGLIYSGWYWRDALLAWHSEGEQEQDNTAALNVLAEKALSPLSGAISSDELLADLNDLQRQFADSGKDARQIAAVDDVCRQLRELLKTRSTCEKAVKSIKTGVFSGFEKSRVVSVSDASGRDSSPGESVKPQRLEEVEKSVSRRKFALENQKLIWQNYSDRARPNIMNALGRIRL